MTDKIESYQNETGNESDICARKHRGHTNSQLSFRLLAPHCAGIREQIYTFIKATGDFGATCEEIHLALGIPYTTVSGRLADLKYGCKQDRRARIRQDGVRLNSRGRLVTVHKI